jgi:hypothetical protein
VREQISNYDKAKTNGDVPEGPHMFRATKAYRHSTSRRFIIRWVVVGGPDAGLSCMGGYNDSVQGSTWLLRDLKSMGVDVDATGGFDPDEIVGKHVEALVKHKDGFVNIQGLKRPPAGWTPPADSPEIPEHEEEDVPF